MLDYTLVKSVHVGSVILSGAGFALRGLWMLSGSELLRHRVTRIVPHVVDTVLLASAIVLVAMSGQYPTTFPWVAAKIIALVVYIVLGAVALKRGRTLAARSVALLLAAATFAYIVAVALARNPAPWTTW